MVSDIFQGEVLTAVNAEDAIDLVKNNNDIVLIISDFRMKGGGAPSLYEFIRKENGSIPFGILSTYGPEAHEVFSTFYEDNPKNFHITKPFQLSDLEEEINKALPAQSLSTTPPYVRLSFNVVTKMNPTCLIHIKLSDEKYVAIIGKDSFDREQLENYRRRGIEDFFIKKDDFSKEMYQFLKRSEDLRGQDDSETIFSDIEKIQLALTQLGVSEEIVHYAEQLVEDGLKSFRNYSKLDELLVLLEKASGYVQKHAYLAGYLAVAIAKNLDQLFDERDCKRLIMASLFKDVALVEKPELASIYGLKDPRLTEMSEAERHQVKIHMQDAAHLLESIPEFDSLTRELVLSHHERPRGDGFPRGKNITTLHDLSFVFMLSCQFAHDIIQNALSNRELTLLAQNYAYEYTGPRFEPIYQGFVSAFQRIHPPA